MEKTALRVVAASAVLVLAGVSAAAAPPVPRFEHVVVIVFENKEASSVLGSSDAPTFNRMAQRYATLTRYYGVTHPSLPNYLALVSGSTQGITSDCTSCRASGASLADTISSAGRTWKLYAEGLPRPGFTGAFSGRYAKKHDPLVYFRTVTNKPAQLKRVV